MSIGSYIDKDSAIHALHPMIKNLIFISAFVICLMTNNPLFLFAVFLIILAVGKSAKLPIKQSLRTLKNVALLIIIFSLLIWPFSLNEGRVLAELFGLKIYLTGVLYGISMSLRFCDIVLMSIYWMMFTSIDEITLGFVKMGIPYKVAFSFSMSLRFVPLIMNDLRIIKDAQKSRGLEMDRGRLVDKIKKNVMLMIPLSSKSLGLIKQISTCLEARGFESGKKRTFVNDRKLNGKDTSVAVVCVILAAALIILRIKSVGLITTSVL